MGFGSSLGGSGGEVIEAGGLNRIRLPDCGDPIFCDVIMGGGLDPPMVGEASSLAIFSTGAAKPWLKGGG